MTYTNGIESNWAMINRGHNGVYHNRMSPQHLKKYVDEFVGVIMFGSLDAEDRRINLVIMTPENGLCTKIWIRNDWLLNLFYLLFSLMPCLCYHEIEILQSLPTQNHFAVSGTHMAA